jgi:hypothetical protein
VAFIGAPVALDFKAAQAGSKTSINYGIADLPVGASLKVGTGHFAWQPAHAGTVSFIVTAVAGETMAARRVTIEVAANRSATLTLATAEYHPGTPYVAASLRNYQSAEAAAKSQMDSASDAGFFTLIEQLQRATEALEPLTPLLPDGSMDFPKLVAASTIGESIALLVDGNDDTFPAYYLAKDLNYTFDFGSNYTFSATAFAMEGRLNFEDRMANTKFYGSNDGKQWTELTPAATRAATELTKIEVAPALREKNFRYLRLQKQGGGLFEPAELRIYGRRHETGGQ